MATRWWQECKVQPRAIKPRLDALKIQNTKPIQAIKLNILNIFYQNKSFEILKQIFFEDEQLIRYFLFQFQFHIVTKSGLASLTTFHK